MENIKQEDYSKMVQNKARMDKLSEDFVQYYLGAEIEDIEEKKNEFILIHNENRKILGKPERIYK